MRQKPTLPLLTVLIASSALCAGCGSGASTSTIGVGGENATNTTAEQATSTEPTPTSTTPAVSGPPPCAENPTAATCTTEQGTLIHQVQRSGTLHLKSLTARVTGIRTAESLSGPNGGSIANAKGKYLIITLQVTNEAGSPQAFANSSVSPQIVLSAGGEGQKATVYTQAFKAENGPDQSSFTWKSSEPTQSGESETGDIIFDVPASVASRITSPSAGGRYIAKLYIGNYGADLTEELPAGTGTIGLVVPR